jgi:RNA polymerase sigma factor (sigma-70 family)
VRRRTREEVIGERVADALRAACHPRPAMATSVPMMGGVGVVIMGDPTWAAPMRTRTAPESSTFDVDALVIRLFEAEGRPLVRLVRLFVDDRNAAEDLVQEGFIRLARNAHRIKDESKAPAYLRSIVLNLVRDNNRRGLVSLRHHLPFDGERASTEDEIVLRDDQREVVSVLRGLPHRQRDCLVLRYYEELGIDDIAETLGISRNSVKTHLQRGLAAMEVRLGVSASEARREETLR